MRLPGGGAEGPGRLRLPALAAKKRTKSGVRELDVKPHLRLESLAGEGETCRMTAVLPCGPAVSVNPALVVQALSENGACQLILRRAVRERLLNEKGEPFA